MSAQVTQQEQPNDRLAVVLTSSDLDAESATALRAAFVSMFDQADEWAQKAALINVTSVDQKREMKLARESRLALREIRVNAENKRKKLKEDSLRRGKAIDGIANVLKALIEPIEEHLKEQETFAERHEAARISALTAARAETLSAYGADAAVYAALGEISEEAWSLILDTARLAHEARLEAARVAEAKRIADEKAAAAARETARIEAIRLEAERVERERVQAAENSRLKAEAAEREAAARAERERVAEEMRTIKAEADAREALARAERERDAKAAAEREEAIAKAAREEFARIEREREEERRRAQAEALAERAEAEAKALAERERASAEFAAERAREAATQKAALERAERATPTRTKYAKLVAALHRIAAWDDDSPDEPRAAAKARAALAEVGITGPEASV